MVCDVWAGVKCCKAVWFGVVRCGAMLNGVRMIGGARNRSTSPLMTSSLYAGSISLMRQLGVIIEC